MSFYNTTSQSRRDKILHAALKLFYSKGYFNTSVHDIREQAEVSIGLVYRYFQNKEKIALTVYSELLQDMTATIEQIIASHDTAHDRCRAIITYFLEKTETFPEMVDFVFFARHHEILPNGQPICASRPPELVRDMVAEGIKNGEIRPMPVPVATTSIFGGTFRLIQQRLMGVVKEPLPSLLDYIWDAAWRAVTAG